MKEILCYQFEAKINANLELVFECLNRDKHVLKWNSQIIENIYDGNENDIQEGSTYITRQKVGKKVYELEGRYIKYDPPYYAIVETTTKEGISKTEYKLKETPDGTQFIVNVSLIPSNWGYKVLTNMVKWSLKHVYNEQFNDFINYVYKIENQRN